MYLYTKPAYTCVINKIYILYAMLTLPLFANVSRQVCSSVGLDRSREYQHVPLHQNYGAVCDIIHNIFHVLGRFHEHNPMDNSKDRCIIIYV